MPSFAATVLVLLLALVLACCSDERENDTRQTESYQTQSAEIGHEAAKTIKAPMENAQDAVDRENERMQEYEKHLRE